MTERIAHRAMSDTLSPYRLERAMSDLPTLSPAMRRMLSRIVRHDGVILESQISAAGRSSSKCLNDLLVAGLVDITAHPTVRERGGAPAAAVVPTAKGRMA